MRTGTVRAALAATVLAATASGSVGQRLDGTTWTLEGCETFTSKAADVPPSCFGGISPNPNITVTFGQGGQGSFALDVPNEGIATGKYQDRGARGFTAELSDFAKDGFRAFLAGLVVDETAETIVGEPKLALTIRGRRSKAGDAPGDLIDVTTRATVKLKVMTADGSVVRRRIMQRGDFSGPIVR